MDSAGVASVEPKMRKKNSFFSKKLETFQMTWNAKKTCFQLIPRHKKFWPRQPVHSPASRQPCTVEVVATTAAGPNRSSARPKIFILHFALKMKDILFSVDSENKKFFAGSDTDSARPADGHAPYRGSRPLQPGRTGPQPGEIFYRSLSFRND